MNNFTIVMAFKNGKNSFRKRNLNAVIDRCIALFPDTDIVVAEQSSSINDDVLNGYHSNVKHIVVDDGERFHKTRLLNEAIKQAATDVIVMVDADAYLDDESAQSIISGETILRSKEAGIVYPFDSVDYLTESKTRTLLDGGTVNSKFCDHGVHIGRQTGLCNMYLKSTWEAVRGFDEDFYEWGAEDDAFTFKIKRSVGPISRIAGHVYHLYHPIVNTPQYIDSPAYTANRKLCACIRRMSDDDFLRYVNGVACLDELVDKYEKMNMLDVRLAWACTKHTVLTIDTTIYNIPHSSNISITSILNEVLSEDGPEYVETFINDIFYKIPDLSDEQKHEIEQFAVKARNLASKEIA